MKYVLTAILCFILFISLLITYTQRSNNAYVCKHFPEYDQRIVFLGCQLKSSDGSWHYAVNFLDYEIEYMRKKTREQDEAFKRDLQKHQEDSLKYLKDIEKQFDLIERMIKELDESFEKQEAERKMKNES